MPCFSTDDEYKRAMQLIDHDHAIADLLCRVLSTLQNSGMSGKDITTNFGIDVSMWWHGHQRRDCAQKNARRMPEKEGNANQKADVVFNKNMMVDGDLVLVINAEVVGHIKGGKYAHLLNDYFDAAQLRAIADRLEEKA